MRVLMFCVAVIGFSFSGTSQCTKADVVVLVDVSGSISGNEYQVKEALLASVDILDGFSDNIRLSVITFSDNTEMVAPLTSDSDAYSLSAKKLEIVSQNGTDMTEAVIRATSYLMNVGRPGARKVIVLVSDGQPNSVDSAHQAIGDAKESGVIFFSIYISGDYEYTALKKFMLRVASDAGYFFQSSYGSLAKLLRELDPCM